jgi:hypothetical protein
MYSGTWLAEQTGVKAPEGCGGQQKRTLLDKSKVTKKIGRSGDEPGKAKRMTFLSAHSLEAK